MNFRKIALTILLIRAGMDLDPNAMKKHFFTVIKLSLIPWSFEFFLCGILVHYIFGLPWDWGKLCHKINLLDYVKIFSNYQNLKKSSFHSILMNEFAICSPVLVLNFEFEDVNKVIAQ